MSARGIACALLAGVAAALCGLRVRDGKRLRDARGPLILISNHRSRLDSLLYHHAVGAPLTVCGARAAYFESGVRRAAMRLLNVHPAGEDRARFVSACAARLARREVLLLYPEMRTARDGLGEFRDWSAAVALAGGAPVWPCAVLGERGRRRPVTIAVGDPIDPSSAGDAGALTAELRERVVALQRPVQR